MTRAEACELLPAVLHRGEYARLPEAADEPLLALLLGAVLARLRELPGLPGGFDGLSAVPTVTVDPAASPVLSVAAAADALGISASFAYTLVRRGELPSVRLGRRIVVPRIAVEHLLAEGLARTHGASALDGCSGTLTVDGREGAR